MNDQRKIEKPYNTEHIINELHDFEKLLDRKINLEKIVSKSNNNDLVTYYDKLQHEVKETKDLMGQFQSKNETVVNDLNEKKYSYKALKEKRNMIYDENTSIVHTEMDRLGDVVKVLREELKDASNTFTLEKERATRSSSKIEQLKEQIDNMKVQNSEKEKCVEKKEKEYVKQHVYCNTLSRALEEKISKHCQESDAVKAVELSIEEEKKRLDDCSKLKSQVKQKQSLHNETMEKRQLELNNAVSSLENEKFRAHSMTSNRLENGLTFKRINGELRQEKKRICLTAKRLEILRSNVQKKVILIDDGKIAASTFGANLKISNMEAKRFRGMIVSNIAKINDLRQSTEKQYMNAMENEKVNDETCERLENLLKDVNNKEKTLLQLQVKERNSSRAIISIMSTHDKSKRSITADRLELKGIKVNMKLHELELIDLSKRERFFERRMKDCEALKETLLNFNTKQKRFISITLKATDGMTEKISSADEKYSNILCDIEGKQKQLDKEISHGLNIKSKRDVLKKEMLKLRRELSVQDESRKNRKIRYVGVRMDLKKKQLEMHDTSIKIDKERHFKSKLLDKIKNARGEERSIATFISYYENALKRGRELILKNKESIYIKELQVKEMQRNVEVLQRRKSTSLDLVFDIRSTADLLLTEENRFRILEETFESPNSPGRISFIGNIGEKLNLETIEAKSNEMQGRVGLLRKNIRMKETKIELITNESRKMQNFLSIRKKDTEPISTNILKVQEQIRNISRKIIALLSEVSMYKSIHINIQEHFEHANKGLNKGTSDISDGKLPSNSSRARLERAKVKKTSPPTSPEIATETNLWREIDTSYRTTADIRPLAYIPNESLGAPKPYGYFAPFKPSRILYPTYKEVENKTFQNDNLTLEEKLIVD